MNRAVQVAIMHGAFGLTTGAVIEALFNDFNTDETTISTILFETAVQLGLNGVAIGAMTPYLSNNDPTSGIPFAKGLYAGQPELSRRLEFLSTCVKAMVLQASLRMTLPVAAAQ